MNPLLEQQISKTFERWNERKLPRTRNERMIKEHRYFDADTPTRVKKFLTRRGISTTDTNEILKSTKGIPPLLESVRSNNEILKLERVLGTNDLLNISYLQAGLEVGKTIGRVWINNDSGSLAGYGTGFMVSPRLMLTNHHVLPDFATATNAKIEFRYELDLKNNLLTSQIFQLDPKTFYVSDEDLDFALVAVLPENQLKAQLADFGWNKLSREEGKTIISQWLTIIQHPNGMPKQIGLRENQVIDVLDNFLHYNTDTAPGSSGSAVYNERWEVVALHHSGVWQSDAAGNIVSVTGGTWNQSMGEDQIKWIANEGVRISSILKFLDAFGLKDNQLSLYNDLLNAKAPEISNLIDKVEANTRAISQGQAAQQIKNDDGSVTWTIPISVTVNVGGSSQMSLPATPINAVSPTTTPVAIIRASNSDAAPTSDIILANAKKEFLKRGDVLNVRMGYVFENEWITNKKALVVTVKEYKTEHVLSKEGISALPDTFMGIPVEVSGPTFQDLIASTHGQEKLETLVSSVALNADEILYFPPPGATLKTLKKKRMRVIAHVSPEKGWENLQKFLGQIDTTLTVGMYDFGAVHILNGVIAGAQGSFNSMTLTLQPGESVGDGTKANDIKDAEAVDKLKAHFGSKFKNAWIRIGGVNGWVSSSYHIKVAVKDGQSLWLSSGNWQSSNQPDIPNLTNQTQPHLLRTYNREWHAIVEHQDLAKTYETFILNDYENNKTNGATRDEASLPNLNFLIPILPLSSEEATPAFKSFNAFDDEREFTVTPLLTPDNFFDEVVRLVKSAESELLIQNQTFNAPKSGHAKLEELLNAVLERQRKGVDVKIIFRVIISSVARENIEGLIAMGFDKNSIRVQKNCHTKGVIVDGKVVLLGSQNWSNDGISVNRDASLLFEDKPLAKYFRDIFMHDWNTLAKSKIGSETISLQLAPDPKNIPPGMELVTWSDIRETL